MLFIDICPVNKKKHTNISLLYFPAKSIGSMVTQNTLPFLKHIIFKHVTSIYIVRALLNSNQPRAACALSKHYPNSSSEENCIKGFGILRKHFTPLSPKKKKQQPTEEILGRVKVAAKSLLFIFRTCRIYWLEWSDISNVLHIRVGQYEGV